MLCLTVRHVLYIEARLDPYVHMLICSVLPCSTVYLLLLARKLPRNYILLCHALQAAQQSDLSLSML